MNDTIHIAFGFDEKYAMPSGVAVLSICKTTPGPICFHLLISEDVTESTKAKIEEMVKSEGNQVVFHQVDSKRLDSLYESMYFSKSMFNRLLIPELLSTEVSKIIYLDCDVVAVKSLRPLWEIELGDDEPAAMAPDSACSNVLFHNTTGIPLTRPYFNSGVVLINIDCWRREGIGQKCMDDIIKHNYRLVDQDALNVVIGARTKVLHLKYNCQMSFFYKKEEAWELEKDKYHEQIHEAMEAPVILHYIGSVKPWQEGCLESERWLSVKAISPWKDVPIDDKRIIGWYYPPVNFTKGTKEKDILEITPAFYSIVECLSNRHPRLFALMRKTLWVIAKSIKK